MPKQQQKGPTLPKLLLEMAVIGVAMALAGLFVGYAGDLVFRGRVVWLPDHIGAMLGGTFAAGALAHLMFEILGVNRWYAQQYLMDE